MKMLFPFVLLAVALISLCQKDQRLSAERIDFPEDLQEWCPYTRFCNQNAFQPLKTPEINSSNRMRPCCRTCSCSADCGLTRSCCTYDLDKYKIDESLGTICITLKSQQVAYQSDEHVYVIDKCPNQYDACRNIKTPIYGTFFPVFSRLTGMIYYNPSCAVCHNQTDIIPFIPTLSCPYIDTVGLLEIFDGLQGIKSICFFHFLVPSEIDVSTQICYPQMIECGLNSDKELQNKCSSFNATFTSKILNYKNVYCYLCRHSDVLVRDKWTEQHGMCPETQYGRFSGDSSLLILLDKNTVASYEMSTMEETDKRTQVCFDNDNGLYKVCRPILCPEGQFFVGGECKLLGANWYIRIVKLWVNLTLIETSMSLSTEELQKITKTQLASPKKDFFNRPALHDWGMDLYYNLYEDGTTIRYVVAALYLRDKVLKPENLLSQIEQAVTGMWKLRIVDSTYQFDAKFNDFHNYFVDRAGTTFYPFVHETPQEDIFLLHIWSTNFDYSVRREGLYISKLHFCRQVDLKLGEFDKFRLVGFREAVFIKHTKSYLGSGKYKILRDSFGTMTGIRTCLSDIVSESASSMIINYSTLLIPFTTKLL